MVILSIDFDGTIVKDEYPGIGKALPGAIQAINELYESGYCIIINSCRARDKEDEMIDWLNQIGRASCRERVLRLV